MRISFDNEFKEYPANIKIVGIGGAGGNAVNRMVEAEIKGVELIAINTDVQALRRSTAPIKLQIGTELTDGLGVGGNPELGKKAAESDRERIKAELQGADMVFVTAGMGGGTGTGGAPVVAEISRQLGALTVGVVTFPFEFEGSVRIQQAEKGIKDLKPFVDTLLVIPNDKLFEMGEIKWEEAIYFANNILMQAVQTITNVITSTGIINVDFADIKTIMTNAGEALMGIGEAEGEDRAIKAIRQAITSPLLEDMRIDGAKGIVVNITTNKDFGIQELNNIANVLNSIRSPEAHLFYGHVMDPEIKNKVKITLVATGFTQRKQISYLKTRKKEIEHQEIFPQKNYKKDDTEELLKPAYLRLKCSKLK